MKVRCIHLGLPKEVLWEGKKVLTGIFKERVEHPVHCHRLHLEGDGQADLKVHGGEHKAVYSYASEHYPLWKKELGRLDLTDGSFGENLTTEGLDEAQVYVGDRYQFGREVILEAAQPRFPCFKLGIRLKDPSIVKTFLVRDRFGIYWRVEKEGVIAPGDSMSLLSRHGAGVRINEVLKLTKNMPDSRRESVHELLSTLPTLCPKLRSKLSAKVKGPG